MSVSYKKFIGLNSCLFSITSPVIVFDRFAIQYILIIGFLPPHVCHAVDTEGYVQIDAEAKIEIHPERVP